MEEEETGRGNQGELECSAFDLGRELPCGPRVYREYEFHGTHQPFRGSNPISLCDVKLREAGRKEGMDGPRS